MAKQRTREELQMYQEALEQYSGVFLVDKPLGISSRQVDSVIKRLIGFKKVGHIGTLDPFATGLLQVCVGKSTSIVPYVEELEKTYKVFVHLGLKTDTLDSQGQVVAFQRDREERLKALSQFPYTEIEHALRQLKSEKEQVPPLYSAIKFQGKALYEYARSGQAVHLEQKKRKIEIYEAQLKNVRWIQAGEPSVLELQKKEFFHAYYKDTDQKPVVVHPSIEEYMQHYSVLELEIDFKVSKGTYIRSLAERLGVLLGLEAYAARLSREQIGKVKRSDAQALSELMQHDFETLKNLMQSSAQSLSHFPALHLKAKQAQALAMGQHLRLEDLGLAPELKEDLKRSQSLWTLYFEKTFVGLVKVQAGKLVPERIFWQK